MPDESDSLTLKLAIEQTDKNQYTSKCLPLRMGNAAAISYGGFQLGIALNAACQSVKSNHYLYSATGYYLGPVSSESKITCSVEEIRNTRTFSTRQVRVVQDGVTRLIVTADFRTSEQAFMSYNTEPSRRYTRWEACKTADENIEDALKKGTITKRQAEAYNTSFGNGSRYWDVRPAPEGIFGQNFNGIAKKASTTQDNLPLIEKTTAEWYRIKRDLHSNDQMGALGFVADAAVSFLPLSLSHMFLDDAGACSSLDFALRVFSDTINMNDWHMVERKTVCGSLGITHSVANIFDTNRQLVAQMSQQSILRPKPVKSEKGRL